MSSKPHEALSSLPAIATSSCPACGPSSRGKILRRSPQPSLYMHMLSRFPLYIVYVIYIYRCTIRYPLPYPYPYPCVQHRIAARPHVALLRITSRALRRSSARRSRGSSSSSAAAPGSAQGTCARSSSQSRRASRRFQSSAPPPWPLAPSRELLVRLEAARHGDPLQLQEQLHQAVHQLGAQRHGVHVPTSEAKKKDGRRRPLPWKNGDLPC